MGIQINNKQVLDMNYLGKKAYSAVLNGDYVFASTLKKVSGMQNTIKDAAALPINKLYLEGNSYQKVTQQGRNILDLTKVELVQTSNITAGEVEITDISANSFTYRNLKTIGSWTNFRFLLNDILEDGKLYTFTVNVSEDSEQNSAGAYGTVGFNRMLKGSTSVDSSKSEISITDKTGRIVTAKQLVDKQTYDYYLMFFPTQTISQVESCTIKYTRLGIYEEETINNVSMELGNITYDTGLNEKSDTIIRCKDYIDIKDCKYVLVVANPLLTSATTLGVRFYNKDYKYLGSDSLSLTNNAQFTRPTEARYFKFIVTNIDLSQQYAVCLRNTTSYEEFVPNSPSPGYPSNIEVIEGSVDVDVVGKNLISIDMFTDNVVPSINSGQNVSGTGNTSTSYIEIDNSLPLVLSLPQTEKTKYIFYYDENYNFLNYKANKNQSDLIASSAIVYQNAKYIRVRVDGLLKTTLTKIQLEYSETVTEYEPYKKLTHIGKNLFDKDSTKKNAWVSYDVGKKVVYNSSSVTCIFVNCAYLESGKTYTISWEQNTAQASNNERVGGIVDENDILLESFGTWKFDTKFMTITPKKSGYMLLGTDINATDIQVEEGPIATEYEPYKKPSIDLQDNFIAKIGDVKDEIDVVTGKLTKRIGKVVLNGSENWVKTTNYYYWRVADKFPLVSGGSTIPNLISTHFIPKGFDYLYDALVDYGIGLHYSTSQLAIRHKDITTLEDFKTWLKSNNVTVYYRLVEPYEVQLDTTKIPLFEGINNIKINTNLEPSLTELDYYIR